MSWGLRENPHLGAAEASFGEAPTSQINWADNPGQRGGEGSAKGLGGSRGRWL